MRNVKQYSFGGLAGCVIQRKARKTKGLVSVYHSEQAGLESGEPSCIWSTVCEKHGNLVGHSALSDALSHAVDPTGWCEACMEEAESK